MTERNWLERNGATPGKLAIVCVLAGVLVFVIWNQVSSGAKPRVAQKTRQATALQKQNVAQALPRLNSPKVGKAVPAEQRSWPKLELENFAQHDPFAMPIWYLMAQAQETGSPGGTLVRSAQLLEELKKQQNKIVVITDDERVAMIGEQSFRVGDTIESFQISEITRNGIVLTETTR